MIDIGKICMTCKNRSTRCGAEILCKVRKTHLWLGFVCELYEKTDNRRILAQIEIMQKKLPSDTKFRDILEWLSIGSGDKDTKDSG